MFLEGKTQITSIFCCKNIAVVHLTVRILLKNGADADAIHGGLSALEMAQEEDEGRSGSKSGLVPGWVLLENRHLRKRCITSISISCKKTKRNA